MRLLIVHPFQRRRDPEAFAWVQGMKGSCVDFVDRVRGEARRGRPKSAVVDAVSWPSIKVEAPGISGRVLAGLGSFDRVRETLSVQGSTHLLLLQTGIEHLAAAAVALAQMGLPRTVVVVDCTDDALEALESPFARELFWRFDGSARAQGAKLVLLAARDRETAAQLRRFSLPVARIPVDAPVGHGGHGHPGLDLLVSPDATSGTAPPPRSNADVWTRLRTRERPNPCGGSSASAWLQYLDSLGDLRNGLWAKQMEVGDRQVIVTDWRPA